MKEEENKLEHFARFNKLPAWQQAETLAMEGTPLASRLHKEWVVTLYALDNYFVELWERQQLRVTTTFQKSARAMAVLEPYMDDLETENLLLY